MKHLTYIFSLVFLCACGSLIQDVDKKRIPNTDQKLVVHGFLSPQDSVLAVRVEYTAPVLGNDVYNVLPQQITTATVQLSDGSKTVNLIASKTIAGEYQISAKQLPIVAGRTYTLNVKTTVGETATSTCTIPSLVTIKDYKQDSVKSNRGNRYEKTLEVFWQDTKGVAQYYRTQARVYVEYLYIPSANTPPTPGLNVYDINFRFGRRGSELVIDINNDGGVLASAVGRDRNSGSQLPTGYTKLKTRLEIALLSTDLNYYQYHKALEQYTGQNPFSEPSLMPTNIKGGLGCFAGYNYQKNIINGW